MLAGVLPLGAKRLAQNDKATKAGSEVHGSKMELAASLLWEKLK